MRCKSCDAVLTEPDLARKDPLSGEFMDLCGRCAYISNMTVDGVFEDKPEWEGDSWDSSVLDVKDANGGSVN